MQALNAYNGEEGDLISAGSEFHHLGPHNNIIQILTGCEVNIIRLLTRGLTVAQGRAAAAGNIEPEVNQRIMLTEMTVQICFVA